ncbi:hypothetical protein BASA81_006535 [Batrachochytrium salamandrivorans]|nr:hypothetical protein BASA81_006535 [Batrachochytrium salamandrivorans]
MLRLSPLFASQTRLGDGKPAPIAKLKIDAELQDSPFAFCSLATLRMLNCFQGCWIEVCGRPTRLFVLPGSGFGVLHVSRTFAFNLTNGGEDGQECEIKPVSMTLLPAPRSSEPVFPPAEQVTIARVRSDLSNGQADYSSAVRAYFFEHQVDSRVVFVGQVFLVKVPRGEESVGALDLQALPVGFDEVPFQVTQIQGVSKYVTVSPTITSLRLVGSVSSAMPPLFDPALFCHEQIWNVLHKGTRTLAMRNSLLVCGPSGMGKQSSVKAFARRHGVHFKAFSLTNCRGLGQIAVQEEMEIAFREAEQMAPCILLLTHFNALMVNKQRSTSGSDEDQIATLLQRLFKQTKGVSVVASSTTRLEELPSVFRSCFLFECELALPDLEQRLAILTRFFPETDGFGDVELREIAQKTAGKSARELKSLVSLAAQVAVGHGQEEITMNDVIKAIDLLPNVMEELSGAAAPKIPEVKWDDVGGLQHAKEEILDMVQMPLRRPELFQSGMRSRSGILLFGPPGTGKTLLAKAVATECAMNFISVKGPELLDMYIGESERKVRAVFETARAAKPCVLFFDELDSLAPQRGKGSDSGGVMDRVVSQLLTEIDGMSQGSAGNSVFIIGATNRPDLLDSSLLRPGRFDRLIYLGICQDVREQAKVCRALTRKYVHEDGGVDFEKVLERASRNLTGADFYALCSDAMASAMKRKVDELSQRAANEGVTVRKLLVGLPKSELQVVVGMRDYEESMAKLVPSVSETELVHYETLRQKFSTAATSQAIAAAKIVEEEDEEEWPAPTNNNVDEAEEIYQ